MRGGIAIISTNLLKEVDSFKSELLLPNGKLKLFSSGYYDKFNPSLLRLFCHLEARYGLPTTEVIEFVKNIIGDRTAIEIGSGHGDLGYHLNIPLTDSKIQASPEVAAQYAAMSQPTIQYPNDVEKLDALEAVEKYKPQVVVGSWITEWIPMDSRKPGSIYGVKEDILLKYVEAYILIGNSDVHKGKPIFDIKHESVKLHGLKSRASIPQNDRIYIWDMKKLKI